MCCSKTDRVQKACECYKKSLKLNPLLWKSYEALCQLGMLATQFFDIFTASVNLMYVFVCLSVCVNCSLLVLCSNRVVPFVCCDAAASESGNELMHNNA